MNVIKFNFLLSRYRYSKSAVKELYEYYYPVIVLSINRQFRGTVDGDDVAQAVFLRLFTCKLKWIRAPNAWIHTLAANIAIDKLRKEKGQRRAEELAARAERVDTPEILDTDILNCLNVIERRIIYLRYWELYKLNEIGELLKLKSGAVYYLHETGKKKLKKEFIKEKDNENLK